MESTKNLTEKKNYEEKKGKIAVPLCIEKCGTKQLSIVIEKMKPILLFHYSFIPLFKARYLKRFCLLKRESAISERRTEFHTLMIINSMEI